MCLFLHLNVPWDSVVVACPHASRGHPFPVKRGCGVVRVFPFGVLVLGFGLLFVAVLTAPAPGWRVRVWRWTRRLDVLRRWHCIRHLSRISERAFSGHGNRGTWEGDDSWMLGMLALVGLPSRQSDDAQLVLKCRRAHGINDGPKHCETPFSPP